MDEILTLANRQMGLYKLRNQLDSLISNSINHNSSEVRNRLNETIDSLLKENEEDMKRACLEYLS